MFTCKNRLRNSWGGSKICYFLLSSSKIWYINLIYSCAYLQHSLALAHQQRCRATTNTYFWPSHWKILISAEILLGNYPLSRGPECGSSLATARRRRRPALFVWKQNVRLEGESISPLVVPRNSITSKSPPIEVPRLLSITSSRHLRRCCSYKEAE